jgi:trehalose 6-phosphate phosphatase
MKGCATHTRRDPEHLFECWPEIARRLRPAASVAVFLDFDGTLARFRKRPEQVRLSARTRRALQRLVRRPRAHAFVLSGRRRADVQKLVAVPEVSCFGLHGWEGASRGRMDASAAELLRGARRELRRRLAPLRDIWIEDKGPIFAVHARGAPGGTARLAGSIVREVMRWFMPGLRLLAGNQVWEVIPRNLEGKGAKVRALLDEMSPTPLPIFVGDDTTDESAFAALPEGITVCVGARRPTEARFSLHGPPEVCRFLERLNRELREPRRKVQST